MNPLEEYNSIIHNRQQNPLPETEYGEVHHIIPKSCGGPLRAKWNLVRLTLDEHIRCHKLLCSIYPVGKEHRSMCFAYCRTLSSKGERITEEEAAERREILQARFKGVPLSDEHKKKLSVAHKGISPWNKGQRLTDEHKKKVSLSMKGKKHKKYVHTEAFWAKQRAKKGA